MFSGTMSKMWESRFHCEFKSVFGVLSLDRQRKRLKCACDLSVADGERKSRSPPIQSKVFDVETRNRLGLFLLIFFSFLIRLLITF